MDGLLAPVPEEHLADALQVCAAKGRVSFGSGWIDEETSGSSSWELFNQSQGAGCIPGYPVLIYATRSGSSPPWVFHRENHVTLVALLENIETNLRSGKHPDPDLRPPSALLTDTGRAALFWEVSGLRHLSLKEQFAFTSLKRLSGKGKISGSVMERPRGPTRVVAPPETAALFKSS